MKRIPSVADWPSRRRSRCSRAKPRASARNRQRRGQCRRHDERHPAVLRRVVLTWQCLTSALGWPAIGDVCRAGSSSEGLRRHSSRAPPSWTCCWATRPEGVRRQHVVTFTCVRVSVRRHRLPCRGGRSQLYVTGVGAQELEVPEPVREHHLLLRQVECAVSPRGPTPRTPSTRVVRPPAPLRSRSTTLTAHSCTFPTP